MNTRGVGTLQNLTSGRRSGSAKKARRSASAADDDFTEETHVFAAPVKKLPRTSVEKAQSMPTTPQTERQDLQSFFRASSAPPTIEGASPKSENVDTSSIAVSPWSSPINPKALAASFEDAIVILDSDSDGEKKAPQKKAPATKKRKRRLSGKENVATPVVEDVTVHDDDEIEIITSLPATPQPKRRASASSGVFSRASSVETIDLQPAPPAEPVAVVKRKPNYYLKNFHLILETVLQKDAHLILPDELESLNKIRSASDDAQRLFVRLLYRRGPWFQVSKIVYKEIDNLLAAVNELVESKVASEPASPVEVLHLLATPQLKNLLKGSKSQASLSSPTNQTPRAGLLEAAKKWITNQRTLFGNPVMPKELGRCLRIAEPIQNIVKRFHRLFFLSQTEDQTALTLVHLGRVAFPTYILPGVDVDDGLEGKAFPLMSLVPDAFKNPYSLALLEQKTAKEDGEESPEKQTVATVPSAAEPLQPTLSSSVDKVLVEGDDSQDPFGIKGIQDSDMADVAESPEGGTAPVSTSSYTMRPRWLIEANLTILTKVGFSSVFPDRKALDDYEEAMQKAIEITDLLGEDLDGTGAAGTTGEITGGMNSTLSAGFSANRGGGSKWGRAARLTVEQIARILSVVNDSVDTLVKSPPLAKRVLQHGDKQQQFDYEKNFFLRRFTSRWIHASIAWVGVGLLEKERNYTRAVQVLRALLATSDVCLGKRGEWWLRLGFDLAHLNQLEEAIEAVADGTRDPHIRPQQRLGLHAKLKILLRARQRKQNAKDLAAEYDDVVPIVDEPTDTQLPVKEETDFVDCDTIDEKPALSRQGSTDIVVTPKPSKKRKRRSSAGAPTPKRQKSDGSETSPTKDPPLPDGVESFSVREPRVRVIQAHPLTRGSAAGPSFGKSLFIGFEADSEVGVEELGLQFYRLKENFTEGSHCEGGPLAVLFGLFLWDIMFDASIPFVFQTPVQDAPLDFGTEDFYVARTAAIEERLLALESDPPNQPQGEESSTLADMLEQSYNKWHGRVCRVVNWTRWTLQELKDIAVCIGGHALAAIFRRFARDFRYSHSGLPDLLLWDPPTSALHPVFVGPSDRNRIEFIDSPLSHISRKG